MQPSLFIDSVSTEDKFKWDKWQFYAGPSTTQPTVSEH